MSWGCRLGAALAIFICCCCLASGRQELRLADAAWHTDYSKALAEARQIGKPLFVTFACLH
jgi:hypothetical protein